ncbi:RDD family protein [Kribbella sp. CA-253562]|uniref:RDD family protein n=1 Tax=Kribbella sp. CA-253562 TaxID=3239942 RepID=UPI003D8D3720
MNRFVDPIDVIGPELARRIEPLGDGRRYVRPTPGALVAAWIVDFLVFLLALVGATAALLVTESQGSIDAGVAGLALIGLIVGIPLVYGMFYGNGRALGALLTGTRLVRVKDGGRLGFWAPWAMLVRVLLLPILVASMFGNLPPGDLRRASLDVDATRRLWEAEAAANEFRSNS